VAHSLLHHQGLRSSSISAHDYAHFLCIVFHTLSVSVENGDETLNPKEFEDYLGGWTWFYAMIGGASATLLGLLFVSLSVHSITIKRGENEHFMRLARLTLSNYLMLITLSALMLVPKNRPAVLMVSILVVAAIGLFWALKLGWGMNKMTGEDADFKFIKRSFRMTFMSFGLMILAALALETALPFPLHTMLAPVLNLLVTSVRNSWGLLLSLQPE
jgi:hypothetical protein